MRINPETTYELHRPIGMNGLLTEEEMRKHLREDQYAEWLKAKHRATDTAGPIMIGGRVSRMDGASVNELFTKALIGGASPCYVSEETGQVHMGEYVLVPMQENG